MRPFALLLGLLLTAGAAAETPLSPADALRQAYAARPSIATNRQRLEEARRNAQAAGAYPATRLDLGKNLFNDADIMGSADLLLYQPLDVFGKSRGLRRQGAAAVATALAAFRQGALDLQQEVLTDYANLLSAQRLLESAHVQRDLAEAVRSATQKRVEARDLPQLQSERAALEVERADGLVADRAAAVEAARLRLEGALGSDSLASDLSLAALENPSVPQGDTTALRPELWTLRAAEAQAEADERVARQGLLPDLEVQAGRDTWSAPAQYGARLQLTATLWDDGATRNKIRAASAARKAALTALLDRVRGARKEIDAAKVELGAAQASVANYTKLRDGARSLLERTRRGFDLGANTLLDVIDARRALSDADELTIGAMQRQDLAIEGLLRAEGRLLEEPK